MPILEEDTVKQDYEVGRMKYCYDCENYCSTEEQKQDCERMGHTLSENVFSPLRDVI